MILNRVDDKMTNRKIRTNEGLGFGKLMNSFDESIDSFYDDEVEDVPIEVLNIPTHPEEVPVSLTTIQEQLDRIEKMLKVLIGQGKISSPKIQEDIESPLYAPKNVTPKVGTMLNEIQSVISQTGFIDGMPGVAGPDGDTIGGKANNSDVVSDICTLPSSSYDDDI